MQIFRFYPKLTESEFQGQGRAAICILTSLPGGSDVSSSLRITTFLDKDKGETKGMGGEKRNKSNRLKM